MGVDGGRRANLPALGSGAKEMMPTAGECRIEGIFVVLLVVFRVCLLQCKMEKGNLVIAGRQKKEEDGGRMLLWEKAGGGRVDGI